MGEWRGKVRLKFDDGGSRSADVSSLADLAGWAALFKESPLYVTGDWVHTGPEPVED